MRTGACLHLWHTPRCSDSFFNARWRYLTDVCLHVMWIHMGWTLRCLGMCMWGRCVVCVHESAIHAIRVRVATVQWVTSRTPGHRGSEHHTAHPCPHLPSWRPGPCWHDHTWGWGCDRCLHACAIHLRTPVTLSPTPPVHHCLILPSPTYHLNYNTNHTRLPTSYQQRDYYPLPNSIPPSPCYYTHHC